MKAALLLFVLGSVSAFGQDDAAMMAAQQASQQATQQATQQALQDMQQASQQAAQFAQQASQDAQQAAQNGLQNFKAEGAIAHMPAFSIKSGMVKPGTKVRIKWRVSDHIEAVYYTAGGWTPTIASSRYNGPIPVDETTQMQAISVASDRSISPIAHAEYVVTGPATRIPDLVLSPDGVLHAGSRLHLVTGSTSNSKTARVGDKLSILLDQDVKAGDAVVISKGTPVDAVLTVAKPAARYSVPGVLVFEVHVVNAQGKSIPVSGGETLEGAAAWRPAEAVIEPRMSFTVVVTRDTPLKP